MNMILKVIQRVWEVQIEIFRWQVYTCTKLKMLYLMYIYIYIYMHHIGTCLPASSLSCITIAICIICHMSTFTVLWTHWPLHKKRTILRFPRLAKSNLRFLLCVSCFDPPWTLVWQWHQWDGRPGLFAVKTWGRHWNTMGPGKRGINIEKQEECHETADYGGLVFKCKQKADNSGTVIMV